MLLLTAAFLASAADRPEMILTSASKQFIIRGRSQISMLAASARPGRVYVEPGLLIVACERVKQAMQDELGWGSRWRGNVFINIHPLRFDNENIRVNAVHASESWHYRIEMPDEVEARHLIQSVVGVLLLEFANRAGGTNAAELPPWLAEGLTAHLMAGPLSELTFHAKRLSELSVETSVVAPVDTRYNDRADGLRRGVQQRGTLNVDQLNWPDFEAADIKAAEAYRASSHLFVRELLKLRGGPDALCATLALSPEHLNWQTAFMRGFEPYFKRMIDVEKWWALAVMQLKTHDSSILWSSTEGPQKLEEILYTPMQVRLTKAELPHVTPVMLQTVIEDWEPRKQIPLLRAKISQLQALRMRLAPELAGLADSYRLTLEKYLQSRGAAPLPADGRVSRRARGAMNEAIADLNALDERRVKLAPKVVTAAAQK
jgi:hypothetical protein